jgi:hypothetical protein
MKKTYSILVVLMVLLAGWTLSSCSNDDLDTNQYKGGVSLNAYGPNPCTRGGTLRFVGSNLDQIASVTIPGVDPITNFEVKQSGVPSEIWVTIPKDGPQPGKITLTAKDGTTLTTQQDVTYQEGVEFTSFSPASVMPGEQLTIKGEYLYLINMVEFSDGVRVSKDDFVSQDRYSIVVNVPDSARTGKVYLYNVDLTKVDDENNTSYEVFESEDALEVGTATVTSLTSPRGTVEAQGTVTAKAGETVTVSGDYLNLVSALRIGDGQAAYEFKDFTVAADGKSLSFKLPAEAPDGDINLISRSGVEVPAGKLITVAPTNLKATPAPVKNGAQLTITGKDLDVVSQVLLPNVKDAVTADISATKITLTVPEKAQEGSITLKMKNGKTVTVAYTLVKPAVAAYSPATVSAGSALTMTGTNLDLVESVSFKGAAASVAATVTADGKSLTTTVPMDAQSGAVTLNLKNGATVTAKDIKVVEAVFCYVTTLPTKDNAPEPGTTVTLPVKNADKLSKVYLNGKEFSFVYNEKAGTITIPVPADATAKSTLRLVSTNGEVSYTLLVATTAEYNINACCYNMKTSAAQTFPMTLTWSDEGRFRIYIDKTPAIKDLDLKAGSSKMLFYTTGKGQIQVNDGNWSSWTTLANWDATGEGTQELILTQDMINWLKGTKSDGWSTTGFIIQGSDFQINKITIIE